MVILLNASGFFYHYTGDQRTWYCKKMPPYRGHDTGLLTIQGFTIPVSPEWWVLVMVNPVWLDHTGSKPPVTPYRVEAATFWNGKPCMVGPYRVETTSHTIQG